MVIHVAKTCCCWYSLQYMLCWEIICWFHWRIFSFAVHFMVQHISKTVNSQCKLELNLHYSVCITGFLTTVQCFSNFAVHTRKEKEKNSKWSSKRTNTVNVTTYKIMPNSYFTMNAGISTAYHHQKSDYRLI